MNADLRLLTRIGVEARNAEFAYLIGHHRSDQVANLFMESRTARRHHRNEPSRTSA
jgi:hypothetical protein